MLSALRFALTALFVGLLFDSPARAAPASALDHARLVVSSIAQHTALARAELRFARTRGERRRVLCLSHKLSELHAQERLAIERERLLAAAVARGDRQSAAQNEVMLGTLRDRARELSRQAQSCGRFGAMPKQGYRLRIIAGL
jgi:hypothetical protein